MPISRRPGKHRSGWPAPSIGRFWKQQRGYARAALLMMIDRARSDPSAHVFRVTVSPENTASLGLVAQLPFVEVGEQWDEEDGLETIFELPVEGAGH